jgi:hypothetical protein
MARLTTRERREARAERLDGWAAARAEKQAALDKAARADEATTGIPFGQPILVGHHSERRHRNAIAKMDRAMNAAIENSRKAGSMAGRAEGIRAQLDTSIYSDDPDAIEALTAKIATLEAERDRIKAYNASCRKAAKDGGTGDPGLLDEQQRRELAATAKACPYMIGAGGQMPKYQLTNLGGNISRLRKRLEGLKREAEHGPRFRIITAKYAGACEECGAAIEKGDTIRYARSVGACCESCETTSEEG